MKTILTLTAAAAAVLAATPAAAQYRTDRVQGGTYAAGPADFAGRIDQLAERLDDAVEAGTIDRAEARSLRPQIYQLIRLEARYSANGLDPSEERDLRQRLRLTRQQLRVADGRNDRYGDWDREDDRYGYDRRDDRDDRYGSNSRYRQMDQVCATNRSAISAILGAMLGSDNCLRVGERVTTGLSAVPSQYRDRYPSRSGYRYGWLEGSVVEYDSRTGVVTGIYDAS